MEWEFLFPGKKFEGLPKILKKHDIRLGAITLGSEGAYVGTIGNCVHVNGIQVDFVDSTGAGDGFVAGLIYNWLNAGGEPNEWDNARLAAIAEFCNQLEPVTCTKAGAIPAFPTLEELSLVYAGRLAIIRARCAWDASSKRTDRQHSFLNLYCVQTVLDSSINQRETPCSRVIRKLFSSPWR